MRENTYTKWISKPGGIERPTTIDRRPAHQRKKIRDVVISIGQAGYLREIAMHRYAQRRGDQPQ